MSGDAYCVNTNPSLSLSKRLEAFAYSPWGFAMMLVVSFIEASFFLIPPEVLLIPLVLFRPSRAYTYAIGCTLASVSGALLGYAIGAWAWDAVAPWFFESVPGFSPARYEQVRGLFAEYGPLIVFVAAFSPIPYKVFTVVGGAASMALPPFIIASLIGRGTRYLLIAWLLKRYDDRIREFLGPRFAWFALAISAALVGVVLCMR